MMKSYRTPSLKRMFPGLWNRARETKQLLQLIPRIYGYEPRECVICGAKGKFLAEIHFPDIFTYDALCPKCGSLPRHRLLRLALDRENLVGPESRVLHFAPETSVRGSIEPRVAVYKTSDIIPEGVDFALNIEKIDQPDASWDVVVCSHVLEHVDHRKALRELHRILAPGGKLLALFPIVEAWTHDYENPAITSDRDRGLHFGKENHVRRFGSSVRKDFVEAGFRLEPFSPIGPEVVRYGLIPGETLFIGVKD